MNDHELAPPSAFPTGDISGKVWATLITTQQKGIYPQKLTWLHYLPCKFSHANIVAHCTLRAQPVHQYIGALYLKC